MPGLIPAHGGVMIRHACKRGNAGKVGVDFCPESTLIVFGCVFAVIFVDVAGGTWGMIDGGWKWQLCDRPLCDV